VIDISRRTQYSLGNFSANTAIVSELVTLTYSDLSHQITRYSCGINNACGGSVVGRYVLIYLHSPVEAIVAQIAAVLSGAVCLPLERQTPLEYYALDRLDGIACMVTDDYVHHPSSGTIDFPIVYAREVEADDIQMQYQSHEYTHCIMTSGTTGVPKAVLLRQEAVLNHIDAKIELLKMDSDSRLCLSMNLSFVASIWQVFATIFVGGTLVVLDQESKRNPYETFKLAQASKANILCIVPSVLRAFLLVNTGARVLALDSISSIVLTGELLPSDLVRQFYEKYSMTLINAYGQTECSDDTFHYTIPHDFDFASNPIIPIGYPIKSVDFVIIDENGSKADKGELCITGTCVAPGYIKDDAQTGNAFRALDILSGRMAFFTGDSVTRQEDGLLVCHGRKDNQIKVSGYRIEPEAIEMCCMCIEGITDALVFKVEASAGAHLRLQYVATEDTAIDKQHIKNNLLKRLPAYMVPDDIVRVEMLAYSSNGKKVRNVAAGNDATSTDQNICQSVPEVLIYKQPSVEVTDDSAAGNEYSNVMFELVKKVAQRAMDKDIAHVTMNDNFIGTLDSFEFVSIIAELENVFNIEFDEDYLMASAFPTLSALIDYLLSKTIKDGGCTND